MIPPAAPGQAAISGNRQRCRQDIMLPCCSVHQTEIVRHARQRTGPRDLLRLFQGLRHIIGVCVNQREHATRSRNSRFLVVGVTEFGIPVDRDTVVTHITRSYGELHMAPISSLRG